MKNPHMRKYVTLFPIMSYALSILIAHIQASWDTNGLSASLALTGACRWIRFWNVAHRSWWRFHQSKCSASHCFNRNIIYDVFMVGFQANSLFAGRRVPRTPIHGLAHVSQYCICLVRGL